MQPSIIGSLFFVISFVALFVAVHLFQKSQRPQNRVVWLALDFISILCWGTLVGGIIDIFRIPINLWSMGAVYLLSAIGLGVYLYKTRKFQKYYFEKFDIIYTVIFTVIIFLIGGSIVGPHIKLSYFNSDAAVHLKNTMNVVRSGHLPTMYMTELHNSMIIEVFMPFIAEVNIYKIFILIDAFFFLLETVFFMMVIRDYLDTKAMKVIGIIICLLYTLGYPLNSYLFSFLYWGVGVMLIVYLLYFIRLYQNNEVDSKYAIFIMMLGCNAVTQCYMLFGPFTYVAVFIALLLVQKQRGKLFTWANVKLALAVFAIPTVMSVYYCYFRFLQEMQMSVGDVISISGGIYADVYINFMWILPFIVYEFIKQVRNKKLDEVMICFLTFFVVTIVLGCLVLKGKVSYYYFYKSYYPMWTTGFIMTVKAVRELWRKSKEILISFASVFVVIAFMNFSGYENYLISTGTGIQNTNKSANLFDLYNYNRYIYSLSGPMMPDEYLDACNYVIENIDDEEVVPMLATIHNYSSCYWYEAITGEDCSSYYGWENEDVELLCEKMENDGIKHFVVYTDSIMYVGNAAVFNDRYQMEYKNDRVIVYVIGD